MTDPPETAPAGLAGGATGCRVGNAPVPEAALPKPGLPVEGAMSGEDPSGTGAAAAGLSIVG